MLDMMGKQFVPGGRVERYELVAVLLCWHVMATRAGAKDTW